MKKIIYSAPQVRISKVELEQGIAQTSRGTVSPEGSTPGANPDVPEWTEGEGGSSWDVDNF